MCRWTHCMSFFSLIFWVKMFACVRMLIQEWKLLLSSFGHIGGMSVGAEMCLYSSVSICACVCTCEGQGSQGAILSLFSSFFIFWGNVSLNLEFINSAKVAGQEGPQTCLSPYLKFALSYLDFYVGFRALNSGSHVCTVGILSHLLSTTECYRRLPVETLENIAANKGRLKMWSLLRKTVLSVNDWTNESDNTYSLCWGLLNFLGKLSLKMGSHESVCICIKMDSYAKGSRIFGKSITQLKVTYL